MAKKKKSARTERREAERAHVKRLRDAQALAKFEPGGAPERAIDVISASVIETQAASVACLGCGATASRIEDHAAREIDGQRLRVVTVACAACALERTLYFRIGGPQPN